ncbi:DUF2207 domain-containing protein [Alkalihalobacillus sp. TS-13]|uniref:DUF2207 domain-containing protein n=1 Tax=Alkalihalobacillus sp. TS-13 TaxID=2842455 RepID=UPI001C875237|nr:DUF2207 domain-containing protein [Alkalihalobacillus sp. TS-13]
MLKRFIPFMIVGLLMLLFPAQALAVEYSITRTQIDAFLQENGNVKVKETHTYLFEGDFNGITRELIPKEGTKITGFKASEDGKSLKVEKEDHLYKVHRKGEDETVTVNLNYIIRDGVDVYSDVAEFYWPFFDQSNESTYENLTVTVHPPSGTDDVIAFGYDEAYNTETIQSDGTVVFHFGEVPDNTKGNIRVAVDLQLFPTATASEKTMKDEILKAEQELHEQVTAREDRRELLSTIAMIGIPGFTVVLLLLVFLYWKKSLDLKRAVEREADLSCNVPKQRMSLPATIYFTYYKQLRSEALSAALLDLVRKEFVEQVSDERFRVVDRKNALNHETILIEWLFDEIGSNGAFSLDDLTRYAKQKKNHEKYRYYQAKWREAVGKEVKGHDLYGKTAKHRWIVGLSCILLLPFLILFPMYGLFLSFIITLVLLVSVFIYIIGYNPKTWEGALISFEWKAFSERLKRLNAEDWKGWTEEERTRTFIYGLGTKNESMMEKNEEFTKAFYNPKASHSEAAYSTTDLTTMLLLSSTITSGFESADKSAGAGAAASSSTSSGGGGSGAF